MTLIPTTFYLAILRLYSHSLHFVFNLARVLLLLVCTVLWGLFKESKSTCNPLFSAFMNSVHLTLNTKAVILFLPHFSSHLLLLHPCCKDGDAVDKWFGNARHGMVYESLLWRGGKKNHFAFRSLCWNPKWCLRHNITHNHISFKFLVCVLFNEKCSKFPTRSFSCMCSYSVLKKN